MPTPIGEKIATTRAALDRLIPEWESLARLEQPTPGQVQRRDELRRGIDGRMELLDRLRRTQRAEVAVRILARRGVSA